MDNQKNSENQTNVAEKIKNIVILSDTHGFVHPDITSLASQCDLVVHAGDVGSGEVLAQLKPLEKTIAVAGNNDEHLANLATIAEIELPGGKLIVEHGHRHGHYHIPHKSLRQAHKKAKLVVYGHTHKQVCDMSAEPWVVNPGAAGKTRTNGGASCLLLIASDQTDWQIKPLRFID